MPIRTTECTVYVCNVANYVIGKADRMLEWHGTCFCVKINSPGLAGGIFMGCLRPQTWHIFFCSLIPYWHLHFLNWNMQHFGNNCRHSNSRCLLGETFEQVAFVFVFLHKKEVKNTCTAEVYILAPQYSTRVMSHLLFTETWQEIGPWYSPWAIMWSVDQAIHITYH